MKIKLFSSKRWSPVAIKEAYAKANHSANHTLQPDQKAAISSIFGGITMVGGIVGVALGSLLAIVRIDQCKSII